MKLLHQIYGLGIGDTRYRNKLKKRLEQDFGDNITFLKSNNVHLPEVVISSDYFTLETVIQNNKQTLENAAKILRDDILQKFKTYSPKTWPPSIEEIMSDDLNPPDSVYLFMKSLLKPNGERTPNVPRIVDSLSQDLVYNVLGRKVLQPKHFFLGLGLHSLTASRKVIDMIHKFGHCVNYNLACEVETAYAEVAQEKGKGELTLPLQPLTPENMVFTHFWVDNFDMFVDKQGGGGSVHTTHLVAYQVPNSGAVQNNQQITVQRRKSRHLLIDDGNICPIPVDKKKNPPSTFSIANVEQSKVRESNFNCWHLVWTYLRKSNKKTDKKNNIKKNNEIIKTTHKKAHNYVYCQPPKIVLATLPYHYTEATDYPVCARHGRCSGLQQEFQNSR